MQLNIRVFTVEIMNGLNAANRTGFTADQQRFGGGHIALTGNAIQQIAFGDPGDVYKRQVLTDITNNPKVAKREFYRTVVQKQTFASVC